MYLSRAAVTCDMKPSDVVFALPNDVDPTKSAHDVAFVQALIARMDLTFSSIHVGLLPKDCIPFSGFDLAEGHSASSINQLLNLQRYSTHDVTYQLKRLRLESFQVENGGRDDARKVGVVVVDKAPVSFSEALMEAWYAREAGIELFVVGIGDILSDDQLALLASDGMDKHVLRVADHCDLMVVVDQLARNIVQQCACEYMLLTFMHAHSRLDLFWF